MQSTEAPLCACGNPIEAFKGGAKRKVCFACQIKAAAERQVAREQAARLQDQQTTEAVISRQRENSIWTREPWRVDRLKELAADPKLSYADIATMMGMTRNQVITKARSLGFLRAPTGHKRTRDGRLARKPPSPAAPKIAKPKKASSVDRRLAREAARKRAGEEIGSSTGFADPEYVAALKRRETIIVPPGQRRKVADLSEQQCRWPIGDPRDAGFHFCHHSKVGGKSYCEHHVRVAYEPPQVQRKKEDRDRERPVLELVKG